LLEMGVRDLALLGIVVDVEVVGFEDAELEGLVLHLVPAELRMRFRCDQGAREHGHAPCAEQPAERQEGRGGASGGGPWGRHGDAPGNAGYGEGGSVRWGLRAGGPLLVRPADPTAGSFPEFLPRRVSPEG